MAKITVDKACCKGCGICINVCPKKVFVMSKARNKYGTNLPEAKSPEGCALCRLCEKMCPDGAIDVKKEENKKENDHED